MTQNRQNASSQKIVTHPHPCNFHKHRSLDRGWGELAFEYRWDSTSGRKGEDGSENPDLEHCFLYEVTSYSENVGTWKEGYFCPPDPPFAGWRFRDPTDGRSGPVGLERFAATQGWAWDRHKLGGKLVLPPAGSETYTILAVQSYWFYCEECGCEEVVSGSHGGPHSLLRTFSRGAGLKRECWRYLFEKHGNCAWMDINRDGYVADSAGIGFSPW